MLCTGGCEGAVAQTACLFSRTDGLHGVYTSVVVVPTNDVARWHVPYPLGRGGGSRPTGVLVQRWVQQRGVRGAAPGDFFTILMDFEAKSTYHTTYRTSLESSHSDLRRSPRSARRDAERGEQAEHRGSGVVRQKVV